jgi:hypothetical protein
MAAPIKKPKIRLFVDVATAKPAIADSNMVPLAERLVMPARSEIVSPIAAKRIGAAAAKTPARPKRMV